MLHMLRIVHSPPRLAADAPQMAKADDDVHFKSPYWIHRNVARLFRRAALWIPISIAFLKSKPLIHERPKSFASFGIHSTAKEIVKFGTPRCLVSPRPEDPNSAW